ncbi:GNAT family N-acetyltransferase [Parapedobacter sp. DT-150]|uniref:GNAT family N-acetyltransferase n=1 Tax=Parapedobacter sp. DT-150 TaxID=3396162 RepID=UPI003F1D4192
MLFVIDRVMHQPRPLCLDANDEIHTLAGGDVVLRVLTQGDADAFHGLYAQIGLYGYDNDLFAPDDTPDSFTQRIVSGCEMIWTVRLANHPGRIVGDCALHHWDKETNEIEFGGSLLPAYRGQGIMAGAFSLITRFAKDRYGITAITCNTSAANHGAIRFAEKMGFKKTAPAHQTVSLKKHL